MRKGALISFLFGWKIGYCSYLDSVVHFTRKKNCRNSAWEKCFSLLPTLTLFSDQTKDICGIKVATILLPDMLPPLPADSLQHGYLVCPNLGVAALVLSTIPLFSDFSQLICLLYCVMCYSLHWDHSVASLQQSHSSFDSKLPSPLIHFSVSLQKRAGLPGIANKQYAIRLDTNSYIKAGWSYQLRNSTIRNPTRTASYTSMTYMQRTYLSPMQAPQLPLQFLRASA